MTFTAKGWKLSGASILTDIKAVVAELQAEVTDDGEREEGGLHTKTSKHARP